MAKLWEGLSINYKVFTYNMHRKYNTSITYLHSNPSVWLYNGNVIKQELSKIKIASASQFDCTWLCSDPAVSDSQFNNRSSGWFGADSIIPSIDVALADYCVVWICYVYAIIVWRIKISKYGNVVDPWLLTPHQMQTTYSIQQFFQIIKLKNIVLLCYTDIVCVFLLTCMLDILISLLVWRF